MTRKKAKARRRKRPDYLKRPSVMLRVPVIFAEWARGRAAEKEVSVTEFLRRFATPSPAEPGAP